jgi:hypothetical protein
MIADEQLVAKAGHINQKLIPMTILNVMPFARISAERDLPFDLACPIFAL